MKTFHSLLAGPRPALLFVRQRIAFPLFLFGAGLMLVQPCAGQGGTWTATGSLTQARRAHTATLLSLGNVLVAGGSGSIGFLASAELYDRASGTWTSTGNLASARIQHTATLLPNGKVLVVGGYDVPPLKSAELYDPASGTWSDTGSLANGRSDHTATLLPNGKVLVVGGYGAGTWRESYDLAAEARLGARLAASPTNVFRTRQRCCPMARCLWLEATTVLEP